jgi:hypothetical protein
MRFLLLAAATGLAACSGSGDVIYGKSVNSSYSGVGFSAFAASGPPVEVFGTPPAGASAEDIVRILQIPGRWPQTPPRLATGRLAPSAQRIRLVFGLTGSNTPDGVCGAEPRGGESPGRVELYAAYCRGSSGASGAKLSMPEPGAVDDPAFVNALARLMGVISPSMNPERKRFGVSD